MSAINLTPTIPSGIVTPPSGTKTIFIDASNANSPALMDEARAVAGLATKVSVGLGSADNTSDTNKPISTAMQTALNLKAPKIKVDNIWKDIVTDYGADPTGSVDCTSLINAAINTDLAAGGVLYFPIGSYKISSAITITVPNIRIIGAGRRASIINTTSATANMFNLSAACIGFENIRLSCANAGLRTAGFAVTMTTGFDNQYLQNVDILFQWSGVQMSGSLQWMHDVNIRETGVNAINGAAVLIDNLGDKYIHRLGTDGTVPAAGFAGIRVTKTSSLVMSDCNLIHSGNAMEISPPTGNVVPSVLVANSFFDTSVNGLVISSTGTGTIQRCHFINCWFSTMTATGITLSATNIQGVDFVNCDIHQNATHGLDSTTTAGDWSLTGCRFSGNTTTGIRTASSTGTSFQIQDCFIGNGSGFGANGLGINVQAGSYGAYSITNNRGLESNTTKGITDLGIVTSPVQKIVAGNLGALLKGVLSSQGATPLSVPVTTETLVLNARIPANSVSVGQVFRIRAIGVMSGANAPTWRIRVGAAGTVADAGIPWVATALAGAANGRHGCEVYLTVRSIGGSGTCNAEGLAQSGTTTTAITFAQPTMLAATTASIITTADWFIDVTLSQTIGSSLIQQAIIEAL